MVGADREFRAYLEVEPHGEHADEARAYVLKAVPAPSAASVEETKKP
jgi:hypothetical protein